MAELFGGVAAKLVALGQVRRQRRQKAQRSPRPRGDTDRSSEPALRGSALRRTSAGRRGAGARPSGGGSLRCGPRCWRSSARPPQAGSGGPAYLGVAVKLRRPMRPERDNIAAPELPGRIKWLNRSEPPTMAELTAAGPVLVHFWDPTQLNSVRALPYIAEWNRRYSPLGLTTLGIHSPRFAFTADATVATDAIERLGVEHAGRARPRLRDLARLRLQGLAVAVLLGPGRRAAVGAQRRGRVPGDRGGDPGRAPARGRRDRAASADGAAARDRRAGGAPARAERRDLSRRLADGVVGARRRTAPRSRSTTTRARRGWSPTAKARSASRSTASRASRFASRPPALRSSRDQAPTRRTSVELEVPEGVRDLGDQLRPGPP